MKEYKNFYNTVSGNDGEKCRYPTILDTYGCGCFHNCKYCYARSLLEFRGFWHPNDPSVADIKKIEEVIKTLPKGTVLRLGGMTDCFQPFEVRYKVTYNTILLLNKYRIHYLIVTKSNMIVYDEYMKILDRDLAHIQITLTSTDDDLARTYERATPPSLRIAAIKRLQENGFDVALRLSPFIPEYLDLDIINNISCKKAIVEFLRVNESIKKLFDIDLSKYTHRENGYYHLPLEEKKQMLSLITGFEELSVCEDCTEAYEYWKNNVNHDPSDCCNLRAPRVKADHIGSKELMDMPKIAFLSSQKYSDDERLRVRKWAEAQAKKDVCIISGFQSRAEREVLDILLDGRAKIIHVLAENLFEKCPQKYEQAVDEGRMLVISPLDTRSRVSVKENARLRNRFVLENAESIVIGSLTKGGMLEGLLADMKYELIGD